MKWHILHLWERDLSLSLDFRLDGFPGLSVSGFLDLSFLGVLLVDLSRARATISALQLLLDASKSCKIDQIQRFRVS